MCIRDSSSTDSQFFVTGQSDGQSSFPLDIPRLIPSNRQDILRIRLNYLPNTSGEHSANVVLTTSSEYLSQFTISGNGTALAIPTGDIYVPADAPTIQAAINIAPSGKTIVVAPGEYFENIIAKSDISLTSSGGPLQTIINGNNEGVVIEGHNNLASNFTLDGFTITGGNGAYYEHGAVSYTHLTLPTKA